MFGPSLSWQLMRFLSENNAKTARTMAVTERNSPAIYTKILLSGCTIASIHQSRGAISGPLAESASTFLRP